MKKRCLDIGSGPYPYFGPENEQWEHLDGVGGPHVEYLSLAYPLPMFTDCTFDEVRASHILEHFHWTETVQVLREWTRIVKPGGKVTIAVPNMRYVAKKIMRDGLDDAAVASIYARATSFWDVHRAGFDPGHLERKLVEAGLKIVRIRESGDGIHAEAVKLDQVTDDIIKGQNPRECIYRESIEITRNDAGKVKEIEGKSFCLINTRGWGDVMASLALARKLKEHGAAWVGLGSDFESDASLVRANESCDYIFRTGVYHMINHIGAWCYDNADYVIDQRGYTDVDGVSFYEARIADVFGGKRFDDVAPTMELAGHVDSSVEEMVQKWGFDLGEYVVIHPQSLWSVRNMTPKTLNGLIDHLDCNCVLIGYDLEYSDTETVKNFGGRNGMDISAGLIKHCKAFVGTDSIWSHVAFAMDKPSFVFYSCTQADLRLSKHHKKLKWKQCGVNQAGIDETDFSWINVNQSSLKNG